VAVMWGGGGVGFISCRAVINLWSKLVLVPTFKKWWFWSLYFLKFGGFGPSLG